MLLWEVDGGGLGGCSPNDLVMLSQTHDLFRKRAYV